MQIFWLNLNVFYESKRITSLNRDDLISALHCSGSESTKTTVCKVKVRPPLNTAILSSNTNTHLSK